MMRIIYYAICTLIILQNIQNFDIWERMGSGVPSGLQNQYEGLVASWVSSILTRSRQKKNIVESIYAAIPVNTRNSGF